MSELARLLERRSSPRRRNRLPCDLRVDGVPYPGRVIDLSPRGLFIQSPARPPAGFPVEVRLPLPGGEIVDLLASLAHRRPVARSLAAVARDGIGLRIHSAPERYFRFLGVEPPVDLLPPEEDVIELTEVID